MAGKVPTPRPQNGELPEQQAIDDAELFRTLKRWETGFLTWFYQEPSERVPQARQVAVATGMAGRQISYAQLKKLRRSPAGKRFTEMLASESQRMAKAMMINDLPYYIDAHKRGTDMALEAEDHRALPNFTTPMLDRAFPKSQEPTIQQNITVQLSEAQAKAIKAVELGEDDFQVLDAEVIPEGEDE